MPNWCRSLRDTPDLTTLETDICIVGSGPGGGVPAVELARAGHRVLVLESGAVSTPLPDTTVANMDVTGTADIAFGRALQFGGSSNLWAGRVAPLDPVDFAPRDWVDGRWPVSHAALAPYYARAFDLMGISLGQWRPPENLPALAGQLETGDIAAKPFVWSEPPFRIGDLLERVAEEHDNLTVCTDAPVTRIVTGENGDVSALEVTHPAGHTVRVTARTYVLAHGGLEIPRLMLASRDGGDGPGGDLVGRYFSTHPKADIAVLTLNRPISTRNALFSDRRVGGQLMRVGLALTPEDQERFGNLNHYVQLSPFLEYRASKMFEAARQKGVANSSLATQNPTMRRVLGSLGLKAFNMIGRVGKLEPRSQSFVLRGFFDQFPDPENRVRLSTTESDALGMPKLDITWHFREDDRRSVVAFMRMMDEKMRAANIGSVRYKALEEADDWGLVGIHSHFIGMTRMGATASDGVVDADNRVFGTDNLYVSGPSVFPTYGNANPFLTITALGLRLADHLKAQAAKEAA